MIFYLFSLTLVYLGFKHVVRDDVYSRFVLPISVNICYILTYLFASRTPYIITNMGNLLVSHYIVDTGILYISKDASKWLYIIHHIITVILLEIHLYDILPLSIGITYLTLFEFSNTFLYIYQLCQQKQWTYLQYNVVLYPFVFTYVPLRLLAIPIYSLKYMIISLEYKYKILSLCLIGFVDLFSIFYGATVGYKFFKHSYLKCLILRRIKRSRA